MMPKDKYMTFLVDAKLLREFLKDLEPTASKVIKTVAAKDFIEFVDYYGSVGFNCTTVDGSPFETEFNIHAWLGMLGCLNHFVGQPLTLKYDDNMRLTILNAVL